MPSVATSNPRSPAHSTISLRAALSSSDIINYFECSAVDTAALGRAKLRHRHLAGPEPRLVHRRRGRERLSL